MRNGKETGGREHQGRTGNALTVVTPVLRGHEKALRDLLEGIGGAIKQNPYFRFNAL